MCMCAYADALWCAAGRGGKRPGSLPGAPWLSDLWRPLCTSSSSSMQHDVYSPLLTAQPRRTESGGAFMMLTLPQPYCRDSRLLPHSAAELFSPSNPTYFQQKRGGGTTVAVKPTGGGGSLCVSPLSNFLLYVFYLTDAFVLVDSRYWKCRVRL